MNLGKLSALPIEKKENLSYDLFTVYNSSNSTWVASALSIHYLYIFLFCCCLVLVKSLKLEMGKFGVVQPNIIQSGISASVSAIFQKFSWLNFNCDKSKASILFPFSVNPRQSQATLLAWI